jgi:hypothetical protein
MGPPTDLQKVEEIMALLRKAHRLVATLSNPANDLDSLLSVAQSESKQLYAATLSGQAESDTIPVILSEQPLASKRPRR